MTTLTITKKMLNNMIKRFTVFDSASSVIHCNSSVRIYADCETEDDYVTLGRIDNELYWEAYPTVERYVPNGTDTSETLLFDETLSFEDVAEKEGIDEDSVDAVIREKYEMVQVYEDDVIAWEGESNALYVGDSFWDFWKNLVTEEIRHFLENLETFEINDVEYEVWKVREIDGGFEIEFDGEEDEEDEEDEAGDNEVEIIYPINTKILKKM
ncbi:hypothetical protein Mpsy_0649 [Methanolobus psychrophilus R15]|nr:hypothetical protein Mpsy_0649 [Methanolobus psychrophilus R15]